MITDGRWRTVLLGFDAREQFLGAWDEARRERYLLVRDVPKPYSVDVLVWPSIFGDGVPETQVLTAQGRLRSTSAWRGPNSPLWEDLESLRGAIASVPTSEYSLIAVSEVRDETPAMQGPGYSGLEEAKHPVEVDARWPLLGYDVADRALFSGLTDCSYAPDDASRLARKWSVRLNANHLFSVASDAKLFALETAQRVPEHAPFFVFALHSVDG